MKRHYPAFLHGDEDIGVTFPDFPGCVTSGDSVDSACAAAAEALQFHIDGMVEEKLPIPTASRLGEVRRKAAECEEPAAVYLVEVTIPERAVRINVTIPDATLAEIDRVVRSIPGQTRSGFLADAAREYARRLRVA